MNRSFSSVLAVLIVMKTVYCTLDWVVEKKIEKFGEEAALFCQVDECCSEQAGWTKEYHEYYYNTIFVDVKNIMYNPKSKYDGRVGHNGFYLFVRNVSEEDLKLSYSCSYGFERSDPKILQKSMVFSGKNTDHDHYQFDLQTLLLVLCIIIMTLIISVAVFMRTKLYQKRCRKCNMQDEEMTQEKTQEPHSENEKLDENITRDAQSNEKQEKQLLIEHSISGSSNGHKNKKFSEGNAMSRTF